jgi:DNA-binding SARP family transcriptional activator
MILCRTLGPVEVSVQGESAPAELLWRKHLALLIYLARSPRRARTREHLIGLLWSEKPEAAARHSLNEALRVMRRAAGNDAVESEGGQVRLSAEAVELDTDRLEALSAGQDWEAAAALIAGDFLEGFGVPGASEFENWLAADRAMWRQRSVGVLVGYSEYLLARGNPGAALEAATRALTLDPGSDNAVRALMRSLSLAGDRSGALTRYDSFAKNLETSLDAQPDVETRALAERIRRERAWHRTGPDAAQEVVKSRRAPLIGRERELAQVMGAWSGCRIEHRAACAVVLAEPGMGKTRLAEEALSRARLEGASVVAVRGVEADATEPWSGVVGLGRGGLLEAVGIAAAPPEALAAFAARIPEWAERFAAAVHGVEPLPVGRALREVLRAAGEEQPIVLVLDDAQWLDRDSLLAVAAALRDLAAAPLFAVIAAAPSPPRDELDDLRSRLGRDLPGVALELGPFSTEHLRALCRWALPSYDDGEIDRLGRRVATDSAGLPLLAFELLHAVRLGLDLQNSPGAWPEPLHTLDQSLPSGLPDAVVAAIRINFRRLGANAQRALIAVAVVGGRVPADAIGRGAGLAGDDLLAALDELEWSRWLTAEGRGYAFVARIMGEVVGRDMVTAGQRARILEVLRVEPHTSG